MQAPGSEHLLGWPLQLHLMPTFSLTMTGWLLQVRLGLVSRLSFLASFSGCSWMPALCGLAVYSPDRTLFSVYSSHIRPLKRKKKKKHGLLLGALKVALGECLPSRRRGRPFQGRLRITQRDKWACHWKGKHSWLSLLSHPKNKANTI